MKKLDIKFVTILVLLGICGALLLTVINTKNSYNELIGLQKATTDTLQVYKDKDGLNVARIRVLETQTTKTFLAFKTQDSIIKRLQEIVKENNKYLKKQGSVTNISTNTNVDTSSPTEIIYVPKDTLPIYKSKFNLGGWVYGKSIANKDSTYLDLKVKNDYTLVIGQEPKGFLGLGKAIPFADIKNLNPYTETTNLRAYQVTLPRKKRWNLGPSAGIQYYDNGFVPYVGVGINYGLIQF